MSHRPDDSEWDRAVREETAAEREDRSLMELLQEVRVTLTGSQILFAFLLIVPFDSSFKKASPFDHRIYLATMMISALAAGLLVSPAAMHRMVFRQHVKGPLVKAANAAALGGQTLFALAIGCASLLVGDYLFDLSVGITISAVIFTWYVALFFVVPTVLRSRARDEGDRPR